MATTKIVNGEAVPTSAEDDAEIAATKEAFDMMMEMETARLGRAATRSALRVQWDGLPAWIRGLYRPVFDAANALLDEGDDEAAVEMIQAAEPNAAIVNDIDPETNAQRIYAELGGKTKEEYFWMVRADFAAAIAGLPG